MHENTNESYPLNDEQFNGPLVQQKREAQNDFTARRLVKFAPLLRMLESENTREILFRSQRSES